MREKSDFDKAMQRKLANNSATPFSMRGQAPPGTIARTIGYLETLEIKGLGDLASPEAFAAWLNARTDEMVQDIFRNGNFGGARKVLSIFLKELHHNGPLAGYLPDRLRPLLEVPLDGDVADGLAEDWTALNLGSAPEWPRIKYLTPELCQRYQDMASAIAARNGICRVDLDLKYWRKTPKSAAREKRIRSPKPALDHPNQL